MSDEYEDIDLELDVPDPDEARFGKIKRGKAPKPPDRLTAIINIHHQPFGEQIYSPEPLITEMKLKSREEHYSRRRVVGENWEDVGLGHFNTPEEIGIVLIENLEGTGLGRKPTMEEQVGIDLKVVEVSMTANSNESQLILPPPQGIPYVGLPSNVSRLMVRCRSGNARIRIHLFPR